MKIDIKARGFTPDKDLNHFAICCAGFELGALRSRIDSVLIRAVHEQPERKIRYCVVEVDLIDGHRIVTRDADADIHVAVYRALERAGWMIARRQLRDERDADRLPIPRQQASNSVEPNRAA